jgi:hypothetical protein
VEAGEGGGRSGGAGGGEGWGDGGIGRGVKETLRPPPCGSSLASIHAHAKLFSLSV